MPTALGYRKFRCDTCRRQMNERTGTPVNRLQVPTDVALLIVGIEEVRQHFRARETLREVVSAAERRRYARRLQDRGEMVR